METYQIEANDVFYASPLGRLQRQGTRGRPNLTHQSPVTSIPALECSSVQNKGSIYGMFIPKKRRLPKMTAGNAASVSLIARKRPKREEEQSDTIFVASSSGSRSGGRTKDVLQSQEKLQGYDPFDGVAKTSQNLKELDQAERKLPRVKGKRMTFELTNSPPRAKKRTKSSCRESILRGKVAFTKREAIASPKNYDESPSKMTAITRPSATLCEKSTKSRYHNFTRDASSAHLQVSSSSSQSRPRKPITRSISANTTTDTNSSSESNEDNSSDSEDELTLGHTPERHQSLGYKSSSVASSSPPIARRSLSLDHHMSQGQSPQHAEASVLAEMSDEEPLVTPRASGISLWADEIKRKSPENVRVKNRETRAQASSVGKYVGSKGKAREKSPGNSTPKATESRGKLGARGRHRVESNDEKHMDPSFLQRYQDATVTKDNRKRSVSKGEHNSERSITLAPKPTHPREVQPPKSPSTETRKVLVKTKDSGHSFFEMLEHISSSDLDEFDDEFLDGPSFVANPHEEEDLEFMGDNEFSDEDRKWLTSMMDASNLCPYCNQPLPREPSHSHKRLKARLHKLSTPAPTPSNPNARSLPWQQAIDFCTLHRAETTIIPLGIRAGYPQKIDFRNLYKRLEQKWIKQELNRIIKNPMVSRVFSAIKNEISKIGKLRWGGLVHQSKEERMAAVKPGYYGEVGRLVLIDHFQNLRQWGYLVPSVPPARRGSAALDNVALPIDPLSPNDFIVNVLVPEVAVFLIMDDRGYTKLSPDGYDEACRIREESARYGDWKFSEGDNKLKKTLEEIRREDDDKRKRLKKLYGTNRHGIEQDDYKEDTRSKRIKGQ
ncbi:uncharacterized protein L203_105701 [Cryptococcus depauperatus CBS 7841]|uniref:Restriction of telomere capping protein 4 n=1 Tax=Cryptococcus depauperatus CBS 7841 TaxID=1295531 RepID=A0A1E3IFV2_9TREE|nr:hypothetical protein L203_03577 [Cryptococcus depauperatus CBS 7841]